jgi:hypothetical protein
MAVLFRKYHDLQCCLCGEKGELTREHKIKAAMLKQEFGGQALTIQRSHGSEQQTRIAQGVKSKHLKFEANICKTCNNSCTQLPDNEFDRFSKLALQQCKRGENPQALLESNDYQIGDSSYLNLHSYFAKLLCCHLAELKAPIPIRLADFSIGKSTKCIELEIGRSQNYEQMKNFLGVNIQYADHGGLQMISNGSANGLAVVFSTTTLGPLQYIFFFSLNPNERLEMENSHREFHDYCCAQFDSAQYSHMTDWQQRQLSFLED